MGKTCCFSGHRILPDYKKLLPKLQEETERHIQLGVTHFLNGGAIGFDILAAEVVLSLKQKYNISLEMVLPCLDQDKTWNKKNKIRYNYILTNADKVTYLANQYYDGCMIERNRYMVDHSDYCIAYLVNQRGGSYYTVNYALKINKNVVNIANLL